MSVGFFGLKNFSHHEMFLVIARCRKSLVMSTPKPDNFMQLFWTFGGVSMWPKCFFIWARNLDEYSKFIPRKGNIYENLNNCHNWNSCVCLIVIKINVKCWVIHEFLGCSRKTRGISMGLCFWPWKFTQFCRISRSESLFSPEFLRVKWQT